MGESFTIQISTNLVNRLADDGEKLKKKTKKPKTKIQQPQTAQPKPHPKQLSNEFENQKGVSRSGWPIQNPLFLPSSTPSQHLNRDLDAIRSVLQESERVVEKLQKQEEEISKEVTQRAKDLHDKEFKLPYQKPMPCLAEKDACLECYKEYANDPLKCSLVVKAFADCARRVRQQAGSTDK